METNTDLIVLEKSDLQADLRIFRPFSIENENKTQLRTLKVINSEKCKIGISFMPFVMLFRCN